MKKKTILILVMTLGLLVSFCDDDDPSSSSSDTKEIKALIADFASEMSTGTATTLAALFSTDSNTGRGDLTDDDFTDYQDLYAPLSLSGTSVDLDADPVTATATDGDGTEHTFEVVDEDGAWLILRWLVDGVGEQLTKPGQ